MRVVGRSLPGPPRTFERLEPCAGKLASTVVCPVKAGMFSRGQTCRGRSQSPVVWIAEEMETEPSKPIDKTSRGGGTSHRAEDSETDSGVYRQPTDANELCGRGATDCKARVFLRPLWRRLSVLSAIPLRRLARVYDAGSIGLAPRPHPGTRLRIPVIVIGHSSRR